MQFGQSLVSVGQHKQSLQICLSAAPAPVNKTKVVINCINEVKQQVVTTSDQDLELQQQVVTDEFAQSDSTPCQSMDGLGDFQGPMSNDDASGLNSLLQSCFYEYDYAVQSRYIEGSIPTDINGSFLYIGPGLMDVYGSRAPHFFDGDGLIRRLTISNGTVRFTSKYVKTEGFVAEQKAKKRLYKSIFSPPSPTFKLNNPMDVMTTKNLSNTACRYWAGKLYTLYEGGLPYTLDPDTLNTTGETDLGGLMAGRKVAAHTHVTNAEEAGAALGHTTGNVCVFAGYRPEGLDTSVRFVELAENGDVAGFVDYEIPGGALGLYHDFGVCDDYYLILENPIGLDYVELGRFILNQTPFMSVLSENDEPLKMHLVPRPGARARGVKSLLVPVPDPRVRVVNHVGVTCQVKELRRGEQGGAGAGGGDQQYDDVIVTHVPVMSMFKLSNNVDMDAGYFTGGNRTDYYRLAINTRTADVIVQKFLSRNVEFPIVPEGKVEGGGGGVHYLLGSGIDDDVYWGSQQLAMAVSFPDYGAQATSADVAETTADQQLSTSAWYPGPGRYLSELCHVPSALGDDRVECTCLPRAPGEAGRAVNWPPAAPAPKPGYLIGYVHDEKRAGPVVVILKADDVASGPICKIYLQHYIPLGLHGQWVEGGLGEADAAGESWQCLFDMGL